MDGSQGAGLPPLPAAAPAAAPPGMVGAYQTQRPTVAPVGRPASDPDQQALRVERAGVQRRLEQLSPGRAKDQKLCVFQTVSGRSRGKPVLTLLATEIEEHLKGSTTPGANADEELDDLITTRLPESAPNGVYKCQWHDKNGRAILDPPPWELTVGEPIDDTNGGVDFLEEDPPGFMGGAGTMPVQQTFAPPAPAAPTPPAPPAVDLGVMARVINQERSAEASHGNQIMTLMAAQHQQQAQMMAQQQQWNKEAEERERVRRAEFRQTLMALIPLALPVLSQWFGPKPAPAPVANPAEALMLEVVKAQILKKDEGISPADMMKSMLEFQTEMAKKQMDLQQTGTTAAMQMQGEATAMVFQNMLKTIKELQDNKPKGNEEKSTLATIAEFAGPLIAAVRAQAEQQQPAPPLPQPPAAPAEAQPRRPAVKEQPPVAPPPPSAVVGPASADAPAAQPRRAAARRRPEPDPATLPDPKRIEAVLVTVRKMSIGEVPPAARWDALRWLCKWMPPSVVEAVKAKNEPKVLELSAGVTLGNATLLQWITDTDNQAFLRDVLEDARLLLTGQMTEQLAEASMIKNGAFVQRRLQAKTAQAVKDQAAIDAHNNPSDTPSGKPVVDAALVTDPTAGIAPPAPLTTPQPPASPTSG